MASYNLFLELAKVIGATRMMELCELYIARNKADNTSGSRFWRDCSDANPFTPVYPPAWKNNTWKNILESPVPSPPTSPLVPKKLEFQSPFLGAATAADVPDIAEISGATLTAAPAGGKFVSEQ